MHAWKIYTHHVWESCFSGSLNFGIKVEQFSERECNITGLYSSFESLKKNKLIFSFCGLLWVHENGIVFGSDFLELSIAFSEYILISAILSGFIFFTKTWFHVQATSVQDFLVKPVLTAACNLKSNAPIFEYDSPNPAIHVQCAVSTDIPLKFVATNGKMWVFIKSLRWHHLSSQYHKIWSKFLIVINCSHPTTDKLVVCFKALSIFYRFSGKKTWFVLLRIIRNLLWAVIQIDIFQFLLISSSCFTTSIFNVICSHLVINVY